MNLIEFLMKTGLTKNESELYIALCREGELNGYEAAKNSGISRANAYQALSSLVDKGGAYLIDGSIQRYCAVPVEEYCSNIMVNMKEVVEKIKKEFPIAKNSREAYITISGYQNIINKIRNLIKDAKERIYISMPRKEIPGLTGELEIAVTRGLKVVAIVCDDFVLQGALIHKMAGKTEQLRIITDSENVLTGSITGEGGEACLYSNNKPLVELIKDSLKNEIRIAELEGGR